MIRRRYLVTYDVADDKRRLRIFKNLHNWGDRIQYSVFVCELANRERVMMCHQLQKLVHRDEDQILVIDLGNAETTACDIVTSLGRPYEPPTEVVVI